MTSWYNFDDHQTHIDETTVYPAAISLYPSLREAYLKKTQRGQRQYIDQQLRPWVGNEMISGRSKSLKFARIF